MKKFRFRLERVLQFKLSVKEEKKRDLAMANQSLRAAEEKLEILQSALEGNKLDVEGEFPIEQLYLTGMFGKRLVEQIEHQVLRIEEEREQVELAMERYIEASKEFEALDTLKTKKSEEYMEYVLKEEEKFLDEMVIQRAGRQSVQD